MNADDAILNHVNEFHFDLGGITLWAPYLRNDNYTQDPTVPRGLGKSSPEEILAAATFIHKSYPGILGEAIRAKLVDGSLDTPEFNYKGVDCSGFIYYVMDRTYADIFGKSLMEELSVPKQSVLNGARTLDEWRSAYDLSDKEAEDLPDDVPMKWVVDTFKRKPVNLCRVAGLVSDYSSVPVATDDYKIGDIVSMERAEELTSHAGLITRVNKDSIAITHSGRRDPDDIGGVQTEVIPLVGGLPDTTQMLVPRQLLGVRRLKSLNI